MQNHKKFTYIQRDISHSLMKKLKKKNVFQNPCNSTHKLRTMPNETIHAKNKTENDNYIDKHKEEKV